jgi:hypothetical protein
MIVSIGVHAETRDTARIETRYGIMDVVEHHLDTVDIRFQGKVVRSFEALNASLYRVTPNSQREFVIVDALTPGMYCHHFFILIELHSDGQVIASRPFGTCKELKGVKFRGETLLVQLVGPYVPGRPKSATPADFEWLNGNIVQLSGEAAPSECKAAAEAAKVGSAPANPDGRMYKVVGQGRLQFLSAPSFGCDQTGVFVIAGDMVRAYQNVEPYTFVRYVNPKSGKAVQGWVMSDRLVEAANTP